MNLKKVSIFFPGILTLILGVTPVISLFTPPALAQSNGAERAEMKWDQLNLTDAQKAQMKQIHESTRQQMDAVFTASQKEQLRVAREQKQKPNLNLSAEQKAQLKTIRQNAENQMASILTSEQKQKLQEMRAAWQQNHQQKSK